MVISNSLLFDLEIYINTGIKKLNRFNSPTASRGVVLAASGAVDFLDDCYCGVTLRRTKRGAVPVRV